ncbi:cache domain-containing protein [Desulforamulus ruminis]
MKGKKSSGVNAAAEHRGKSIKVLKLKIHKLQMKGKLALFIGVLLTGTILLLSAISYINLDRAYRQSVKATEQAYDNKIKTALESMIGVLNVNYQRYLDGEITEQQALESAKKIVRDTRYDNNSYFWVYTEDGACVVHMDPEIEGTQRYDITDQEGTYYVRNIIAAGNQAGGGYTDYYTKKPGQTGAFQKRTYTLKYEPYGWYISTGNYYNDINQAVAEQQQQKIIAHLILLAVSLVVAVLGVVITFRALNRLTGPLMGVAKRLQLLSEGDAHTPPVPVVQTQDEMQILTQATETLILSIREIVGDLTMHLKNMAQGDMATPITQQYVGDFIPIQESVRGIYSSLNRILASINHSADMVNSSASQVADASQMLAAGATEQASAVEELSASIATVSDQVGHNAAGVSMATGNVVKTVTDVKDGNEKMQQMLSAMERINSSSDEIRGIAKTVKGIAEQTNLLALNAAIEAAQAGTAGKGFAVVANEVRNLAGKAAEAAKRTSLLIENSIHEVKEGSQVAEETAQILQNVSKEALELQNIIENIDKASKEQAVAIEQITKGMEQISAVVQNNAATAEECSASSQELSAQSSFLQNEVSRFRIVKQ